LKEDRFMKTIFLATAAIALGGAAIAQTTEATTTDTAADTQADVQEQTSTTTTTDMPATTSTTPTTTTGQTGTMQTTTTSMTTGSGMVAPGNTAPERDARGIPVVSDPAMVPPGVNAPPAVGGTGATAATAFATQPSTDNYPACSRTVTDNCVQAYERGRKPAK
jgi:hypothetical protein